MYNEKKIKKSELLQLILLDNLYAQSGSDRIIFQGGTALRWVYGGMRFSEDLDFVTDLLKENVEKILAGTGFTWLRLKRPFWTPSITAE